MQTKTQQEVVEILKSNPLGHYKKSGQFPFRIADKEEVVTTILVGKKETKNTAQPGDYIITGTEGELFVAKPDVFAKRYQKISDNIAEAVGECWATQYQGESFKFIAPWNEEMILETGDYLISPNKEITEGYRIEQGVFNKTYKAV